jgi:[CysO sulfur-carrier protein]-S-L-cysteine hydrolase
MNMGSKLILPANLGLQMLAHVQGTLPEEACGLLGGRVIDDGRIKIETVMPITNQAHSQVRFFMDPVEQLAAFNSLEAQGLELLGIYHSHPAGPSIPSATDLKEFYYPGVVYVIWSRENNDWQAKAFDFNDGNFLEKELLWTG